ncbi:MAG: autoinducer binding domain-containing protein [Sedimentitalea sp.]
MQIEDQRFAECHSLEDLSGAMQRFCSGLGLPYFSYLLVQGSKREDEVFLTNYEDNWCERYMRKCYKHYDPVIVKSNASRLPFFWDQKSFLSPYRKIQRRVFYEARAFRISSGYSIPVRGPKDDMGVFSIVSSHDSDLVDAVRAQGNDILITAMQAHDRAMILCAEADGTDTLPDLSARELECLKWTAEGKTSDEVGDIIALSSATVNYHINKAITKLAAANRHHAAIIAIRKNLI